MKPDQWSQRLSSISTVWTLLRQAHAGATGDASGAQRELMERYGGAIQRYLLATLRDSHAADDLTQEFALCLLRGTFRRADPDRGRFRDYVKGVLFHLVSRYHKRLNRRPYPLASSVLANAVVEPPLDSDQSFNETWRTHLLDRTWEALARLRPGFHAVLRARADNPRMASTQLAAELSAKQGKALSAEAVRQTLRRARALFVRLLLDEVVASLDAPTAELVEEELRDLNLLVYCQPLLRRNYPGGPQT